jgi:Holliday junction resolvase
MSDIEKIQLIHDVKQMFEIDDSLIKTFIEQINSKEHSSNIERFFRGYKIEDHYFFLQSSLPWVKLIHALQQNQLPESSKSTYQVPDYMCVFESSSLADYPVLIEVKSVKGDKQSIKLMKRQVLSLLEYSKMTNLPLVIAIYWEKYALWTHVPIECFDIKTSTYKLSFVDAFKSDISVIFGNVSFLITSKIFRKTVYGETDEITAKHEEYGSILKSSLSSNGEDFIEVESIESAVIDAFVDMTVVNVEPHGEQRIVLEESSQCYVVGLGNLILRHLNVFSVELNADYTQASQLVIRGFMQKLGIPISYAIPEKRSSETDHLFKLAFDGTSLMTDYNKHFGRHA